MKLLICCRRINDMEISSPFGSIIKNITVSDFLLIFYIYNTCICIFQEDRVSLLRDVPLPHFL